MSVSGEWVTPSISNYHYRCAGASNTPTCAHRKMEPLSNLVVDLYMYIYSYFWRHFNGLDLSWLMIIIGNVTKHITCILCPTDHKTVPEVTESVLSITNICHDSRRGGGGRMTGQIFASARLMLHFKTIEWLSGEIKKVLFCQKDNMWSTQYIGVCVCSAESHKCVSCLYIKIL